MKENIEQMLTQLMSGEKEAAAETFNYIISQKAADAIEAKKAEVIDAQFNEEYTKKVVATSGSEDGDCYKLIHHSPGEKHGWASIVKTHQDGKSLKNESGGYSPHHTGEPKYIQKLWNNRYAGK